MRLRGLVDEDFVNYKFPSMFIGTAFCDWKCCTEKNLDKSICQNSAFYNSKVIDMSVDSIFQRYINNPITKSIVIGGLEPMMQFPEIKDLIWGFRDCGCGDEFIIYTGYYPNEVRQEIIELQKPKNIIVKFGRYIQGHEKHLDNILGVSLASDNQYAVKIS